MSVLQISNLHKTYKKGFKSVEVLKDLSFTIPAGKITGFIGANGAGKTTAIKCILGFCRYNRGRIAYFGGTQLTNVVKSKIGFLPERPYFYEFLTGVETLQFYCALAGMTNKSEIAKRIDHLLQRMDLHFAKDRPLSSYSKGMMQKIGVAQALIHRPELVILDEPMSGLDPDGRVAIGKIIKDIASEGAAVFFSSHLLFDAEKLCDRLVVINCGQTHFEGDVKDLLAVHGEKSLEDVFVTMEKQRLPS